jgi:ABC-type multidrug transport system permease subunit
MMENMLNKQLAFDFSQYVLVVGILLIIVGVINIIASYIGMECYNRNTGSMSEYSVGRNYLTFNMVAISLVTLLGIIITAYAMYGPTILVLTGSRF